MDNLTQLLPQPSRELPLRGAYLAHELDNQPRRAGLPFVYSNFVVSLDGRIAIPHPSGRGQMVPTDIANDRDWRLYQELAAQADLILSTGRYLRDWADGRAQEILQVDDPRFADLRDWRRQHGMHPHPDIAIISGSLDFPIPQVLTAEGRKAIVVTMGDPDPDRVKEIEAQAGTVIVAGEDRISGRSMLAQMADLGYRCVYSGAGPRVLHLLLRERLLDRIYLTHANRVLGGTPYSTIVEGDLFEPAVDFRLNTVYLDTEALGGLGQLFVSYDRA